ncbi:hypothetical protein BCR39DRAFT_544332 [Naematelia encephala]|uniref:Fe2OG dioxygenase domain-containing protein n=1 Tax=Naematelia encephala TaxID=71784 RepID=A0A1Y2AS23_9TREE|nr:hypothetical protein BCR39DRAFT_544332 [Naematelia encephala]
MSSPIPTIDLSADSPTRQAELIRQALNTVGFFVVVNSGSLKAGEVDEMFKDMKDLFSNPKEIKESFPADKIGSGYIKPLAQSLGPYRRDYREAFQYGRQSSKWKQPLPPPFIDDSSALIRMKSFYKACHETSERLLELFALALDMPFEHFRKCHSFGLNTAISMLHYPTLSEEERERVRETDIRAGEHKDWGTLTLLFQEPNGKPGLQIYLPTSYAPPGLVPISTTNSSEYATPGTENESWAWYAAPVPPPGGFLVNVGLAMELWSGGTYKATLHRVVFPEEETEDRWSIAYFVQPDDEVVIQPVMGAGKVDESVPPITSGELFGSKLRESMERTAALAKQRQEMDRQSIPTPRAIVA